MTNVRKFNLYLVNSNQSRYDVNESVIDGAIDKISWPENPFGLDRWADGNSGFEDGMNVIEMLNDPSETARLWGADKYMERFELIEDAVMSLRNSYFVFNRDEYNELVKPKLDIMPKTMGGRLDGLIISFRRTYLIPLDDFSNPAWRYWPSNLAGHTVLEKYQDWFLRFKGLIRQSLRKNYMLVRNETYEDMG